MTAPCTVVVPCFNEARRLDPADVEALLASAGMRVLAVDDGSTDDTAARLDKLAHAEPDHLTVLALGANHGKGEAVRRGMLEAISSGATLVAYCDADFATPPGEMARLVDALRSDESIDAVLGSRVAMLGCDIHRSAFRHYTGRLFATAAGLALGAAVYDTQCGAKAFRVTDQLRAALARPFASRWAFDVELLGRLLPAARCIEVPLRTWHEPGGSKVTIGAGLRTGVDLVRIGQALRRERGGRTSVDRLDEQRQRSR